MRSFVAAWKIIRIGYRRNLRLGSASWKNLMAWYFVTLNLLYMLLYWKPITGFFIIFNWLRVWFGVLSHVHWTVFCKKKKRVKGNFCTFYTRAKKTLLLLVDKCKYIKNRVGFFINLLKKNKDKITGVSILRHNTMDSFEKIL